MNSFCRSEIKILTVMPFANENHLIQSFVTALTEKHDKIMELIFPHICELAVTVVNAELLSFFFNILN
jgi:hypothetical protein